MNGLLSLSRRLATITALCLVASCGGGGGGGDTPAPPAASPPPPPPVTPAPAITVAATVAPGTVVLSGTDLQSITAQAPGSITTTAPSTPQVGDVVVTDQVAIKVASVARSTSGATVLTGDTPALSDALSSLTIDVDGYVPTPDQFVPAGGDVTVVDAPGAALAASRSRAAGGAARRPTAVTVNLSKSFSVPLSGALTGTLDISIAPTLDYHVDSRGPSGRITFRAPITAKPSLSIAGNLGRFTKTVELGKYVIPLVVPGLPPLSTALVIPISLVLTVDGANVNASIGTSTTADYGLRADIANGAITLTTLGDGFSYANASDVLSLDAGVSTSVSLAFRTGVELSAFYDHARPIKVDASAGLFASLISAQFDPSLSTFDPGCLSGKISGVASANASLDLFFGASLHADLFASEVPLTTFTPASHCTSMTLSASPAKIVSGERTTLVARLVGAAASPLKPTGTFDFTVQDSGASLCQHVAVSADGSASCNVTMQGAPETQATLKAAYSGDGVFASGVASSVLAFETPLLTISPSTATLAPGQTLQLTATEVDLDGNTVTPQAPLSWSSDNSMVTVDAHGLVTVSSNATGSAKITASDALENAHNYMQVAVSAGFCTSTGVLVRGSPGSSQTLCFYDEGKTRLKYTESFYLDASGWFTDSVAIYANDPANSFLESVFVNLGRTGIDIDGNITRSKADYSSGRQIRTIVYRAATEQASKIIQHYYADGHQSDTLARVCMNFNLSNFDDNFYYEQRYDESGAVVYTPSGDAFWVDIRGIDPSTCATFADVRAVGTLDYSAYPLYKALAPR